MSVIINPDYVQLEYIESPGNAYIDTLWANSNKTTIDCKFVVGTSNNNYIFGSRQNSNNYLYNGIYRNNTLEYNWTTGLSFTASNTIEMTQSISGSNTVININGTSKTIKTGTTADTNNIFIFACNNSSVRYYTGKTKCYYFKIKENNTVVRNFIPCKRTEDNIAGLYDIVNDEFYKSKGAANFTAGPEVSHSMSLSITPTSAGDIILTGPYITGGNALISFEAVSNYTLSGFYNGSTLLSKDSPLKVEVGGSITSVKAKMTPCGRGTIL